MNNVLFHSDLLRIIALAFVTLGSVTRNCNIQLIPYLGVFVEKLS